MNERFDAELRERLERLAAAVPDLDALGIAVPVTSRPGRPTWRVAAAPQLSAPLLLVSVVVLVGVGLLGIRGLGGPTTPAASHGAISATTTDGPFRLTIRAGRDQYQPTDEIRIEASLVYTGPDAEVAIFHGLGGPLGFGITERVHGLQLTPGWLLSCNRTVVARDMPISETFSKSGDIEGDDPDADAKRRFLTDPVLRLPPGTWHVFVVASFGIGDCARDPRAIQAELTIVVGEAAPPPRASPSATATGEPAAAFPDVCAALGLTENRCASFAAVALERAGISPSDIVRIEMTKVDCPGGEACASEAVGYRVGVLLVTAGGEAIDEVVDCTRRIGASGGIDFLCSQVTTGDGRPIQYPFVTSPTSSGYWDIPCTGEAPIGCATPLPTIEPSELADAVPLEIDRLDIPIEHAGAYSVVLGEASLPNGILSTASAEIASSPSNPLVTFGGYTITITSLDGGSLLSNAYEHGWRPGTERVRVTLDFVVLMFQPGASVEVVNIVVE